MSRHRRSFNPLPWLAVAFVAILTLCSLLAPWIAPHDPNRQDLRNVLRPPMYTAPATGHTYLLGTDYLGRDVFSRVIHGTRVSLLIGLATVLLAGVLGSLIGMVAGYFGGAVDLVLSYFIDVQLSIPFFALALAVASILRPGLWSIVLVLVVSSWPTYARLARTMTRVVVGQDYLEAARALGVPTTRIVLRHVTPNLVGVMAAYATVEVARTILAESALSFLGMGVPSSMPSWGLMTSEGRDLLAVAWWVSTFPGLAILTTAVSISMLGDLLQQRFRFLGE